MIRDEEEDDHGCPMLAEEVGEIQRYSGFELMSSITLLNVNCWIVRGRVGVIS